MEVLIILVSGDFKYFALQLNRKLWRGWCAFDAVVHCDGRDLV